MPWTTATRGYWIAPVLEVQRTEGTGVANKQLDVVLPLLLRHPPAVFLRLAAVAARPPEAAAAVARRRHPLAAAAASRGPEERAALGWPVRLRDLPMAMSGRCFGSWVAAAEPHNMGS